MLYVRVRKENECQHTVGILGISDDAANHDGISMAGINDTAVQWVEHVWAMTPFIYAPQRSP